MDIILGILQALMALFGYVEEQHAAREQCEQLWAQGYVVYPMSEQEHERAKQCASLRHD